MATYVYRCTDCGSERDKDLPIGTNPPCFPCSECGGLQRQVIGVGLYIASDALPNKRHGVRATNAREARWERDMPAYKDARTSGLQPRAIDGCADQLRNVDDQVDIDYRLTDEKKKRRVKNQIVEMSEALTGTPPVSTHQ